MRLLITFTLLFVSSLLSVLAQDLVQADDPPKYPVGEDAYIHWDKLPFLRFGVRAYMRSTYDRDGNNRGADASHYLYQENDTFNVTLDVMGPGILYFKRTNHFHGSPWHYEIDGTDLIVKETATLTPTKPKDSYNHTEFIPQSLFPYPLTWTWTTTKGANLMWRPINFNQSFRIAYSRTYYGTGYYIYHQFPYEPQNDKPIKKLEPPKDETLSVINNSGMDIGPTDKLAKEYNGTFDLQPFESKEIIQLRQAPSMVRGISFRVPRENDFDFGKCRLLVTWDNRWHESIDVPIDLFFGSGALYNNNDREFLVKGLPLNIRYSEDSVYLNCYWPMPFFTHAKFEIQEKSGKSIDGINWEIVTVPYNEPINHVGYFHATYSDHPKPELGEDLTFLDTDLVEGGGPWTGHFVGMSWTFSENGELRTLEGDPRIFLDDSRTPQGWGTGTEEWGGGGDYWGGQNMTIPLAGHPMGKQKKDAENPKDLINSAYRFLVADFFPFGKRAEINLEHGGINSYPEHYSGVTYWYGLDAPSLILTDELSVFNPKDVQTHGYSSPTASDPYMLVSRYELGPDHDFDEWGHPKEIRDRTYGARMYYPAERDSVRTMSGTSQFFVDIDAKNHGVMLRRKFDYLYPNQHAKVYVKDSAATVWNYAGEWYTSGSNTCVYSRPEGKAFSDAELSPPEHHIITSNRRWREEEFQISKIFTQGISKLAIKIEFIPENRELFPGYPYPAESKWSASRYMVYSYIMPYLNQEIHQGGLINRK